MKIIACRHPQYKYCFVFEYSEKMEWYCKSLNNTFDAMVMFFADDQWMFNDIKVASKIQESFPMVEIDDETEMDMTLGSIVTSPFVLRDYQLDAVNEGIKHMTTKGAKGGVLVLPTGAGKSLVIASIAQGLPGKTIVLQPTKEILEQNHKKAVAFGFNDIGIFSASLGQKNVGKITFATIGTIISKKELFLDFTNLIIDECHLVNSKGGQYEEFISFFGGRCVGLTATPYRLHSYNDMKTGERAVVAKFLTRTKPRIFNTILHVTQVKDLYDRGFLCPVVYESNGTYNQSEIKLNSTGADFDEKSLAAYNEKMGIVDITAKIIKERKSKYALVFTTSVTEAEQLGIDLNLSGIKAVSISAKTPKAEREFILSEFKAGKIQAVTNVGVLTTGFDFPELDCVILARPTQSVALYYQMIGRGIRIANNKKYVRVIDVCGNVSKFGRVENFDITPTDTGVRLKSNVGYLTGVNFATMDKEDIESTGYANKEESTGYASEMITFGQHKGKHITKVPSHYLTWALTKFGDGQTKAMFIKELARREPPLVNEEPIENLIPKNISLF